MKLKVTLLLIFSVLLMMLGAGAASAYIGYLMGREALKVVTQPDTDSESTADRKKPVGGSHKGLKVVAEKTILVNVYNHIHEKTKSSSKYQEQSLNTIDISSESNKPDSRINPDLFPLQDRSGGVVMEISQAKIEGNSLMLDVNFKNEGDRAVRFLYSFLDVRDEANRPLSAIADGLPGEIPANGKTFSGKFMIPMTLLDNSQQISLTLEDYPERRLTFKFDAIPLNR